MRSEWSDFYPWLMDQRVSNRIYFWMSVALAVEFVVLLIIAIGVSIVILKKGKEENDSEKEENDSKKIDISKLILFVDILAVVLDLAALFFVPVKELLANCDTAVEACYEEAEALYDEMETLYDGVEALDDDSICQQVKGLYKSIAFTGYKDCREKIKRCDYISSSCYFAQKDYEKAFELLFSYLSAEIEQGDEPIYEDMRRLLEDNCQGISAANRENQMIADSKWMQGRWSGKLGWYIDFSSSNEEIFVDQNLYDPQEGNHLYKMNYGVYSISKTNEEDWETMLIFYLVSPSKSYVYNSSNGKMYFLTRSAD